MAKYVAAVDQGTTSTRCHDLRPRRRTSAGARPAGAPADLPPARLGGARPAGDLGADPGGDRGAALRQAGVRGRRTWRPSASPTSARPPWCGTANTGQPYHNAIVWQDTRTDETAATDLAADGGQDRFRHTAGLPLATYFSGPKIAWLLDNVPGRGRGRERRRCCSAPIDTWLIWNLTGGPDGGVHVTDVTNASRTMLMDLDDAGLGRRTAGVAGHPARHAARDPPLQRPSLRHDADGRPAWRRDPGLPATWATSRRPLVGRPASRRGGQEHLRHRLLHAAEHRTEQIAHAEWTADDGALSVRRPSRPFTPWRGPSPSPGRWCNGCATIWASSTTPPESKRWPARSRTTAASTSCRPFPACLHPIGAATRAGSIVGLTRYVDAGPHRPGRPGGHRLPDPRSARRHEAATPGWT